MTVYTAFISSPRPAAPYWDGASYSAVLVAEVTMLDSQSRLVPAYGLDDQQFASVTIQSDAGLAATDNATAVRTKVAAVIRRNWDPTITATDTIKLVWLDGAALISI